MEPTHCGLKKDERSLIQHSGSCLLTSLFFKFSLRTLRLCGEKHV